MSDAPATADETSIATTSSTAYWEAMAESCVRVTMAGFAGSLVGLAKERQQQLIEVLDAPHQRLRHNAKSRPRRPPRLPIKTASTNLPMTWSLSCMLFAAVLESCRRASPTDYMWEIVAVGSESSNNGKETESLSFAERSKRKALTSIGDYTIGGAAAGLAGAVGQQKQRSRNSRPATRFGLATGLGLGLLAGTIQAAIDVGNLFLEREQAEEYERRRVQEEEEEERLRHQDDAP